METLVFELLKQQAITALTALIIAVAVAFHFIFDGIDNIQDGRKTRGICKLSFGLVVLMSVLMTLSF